MFLGAMIFFQSGVFGQQMGLNLIQDRKIKFRVTLQLVGVHQSIYLVANYLFSLLFATVYTLLLLTIMVLSYFIFHGEFWTGFSVSELIQSYFTTLLFLLSFLSFCASFSAILNQYDYASNILKKFTFVSILIPFLYIVSQVVIFFNSVVNNKDNKTDFALTISWGLAWLPNQVFIQAIFTRVVYQVVNTDEASNLPIKLNTMFEYNLVLFLQFLVYTLLYYVLDRTVSTDTASSKVFFSKESDTLGAGDVAHTLEYDDMGAAPTHAEQANNLITIKNLTKKFGDFTALNQVDLELNDNKIHCLLGHNGAGKTTLIDIMTGFKAPTEGGVYLNGKNIHYHRDILFGNIGYSSSHDPLFETLKVGVFLEIMANLKGCSNPRVEAERIANEVQLGDNFHKRIKDCSGGTKRRVSIASSLVGDPTILFLDEPSTGVDPENRREIWNAINQLRNSNRIILMTTHHLEEAEFLSDNTIILSKGEIKCQGTNEEIKVILNTGYKVTLSKLERGLDEVKSDLSAFAGAFTIDDSKLSTSNQITLDMKREATDRLPALLEYLENSQTTFNLMASSLEDAFITMGESEFTAKEYEEKSKKYKHILNKKFHRNEFNKINAMILRKLFLLFNSVIQIFNLVLLIIVPLAAFWIVVKTVYDAGGKTENGITVRIPITESLIVPVFVACTTTYYIFACGFFGLVPIQERFDRIRHLLKMNNVSALSYYCTIFLADIFLIIFISTVSLFGAFIISRNYVAAGDEPNYNIWVELLGILILFMMCFASQSYFVSYLFSTKQGALKYMNWAMVGVYLILQLLSLSMFTSPAFEKPIGENFIFLMYAFFIPPMATTMELGDILQVETAEGTYVKDNRIQNIYFASMAGMLTFFLGAMMMDYIKTRIQNANHGHTFPTDRSGILPLDPDSLQKETNEATYDNPDLPIAAQNVSKKYGQHTALANVSLTIKKKEIVGLLGPNGAGKSTFFNIMSNYIPCTSGKIRYFGKALSDATNFYDKTGLCAQDDIIWPELSVQNHLDFYGALKGVDKETIDIWLEILDLDSFRHRLSAHLSTGMKRKLCYIICMMSNPGYKFLDEPTSGLDPLSRKLMRRLMMDQRQANDGSCLFTTHTMQDAEDMCDRILILINGKPTIIQTVSELRNKLSGVNVSIQLDNTANIEEERTKVEAVFSKIFPESLILPPQNPFMKANDTVVHPRPEVAEWNDRKTVFLARNPGCISKKFSMLQEARTKGEIKDFELSQQSLENLFLFLARDQAPRMN